MIYFIKRTLKYHEFKEILKPISKQFVHTNQLNRRDPIPSEPGSVRREQNIKFNSLI